MGYGRLCGSAREGTYYISHGSTRNFCGVFSVIRRYTKIGGGATVWAMPHLLRTLTLASSPPTCACSLFFTLFPPFGIARAELPLFLYRPLLSLPSASSSFCRLTFRGCISIPRTNPSSRVSICTCNAREPLRKPKISRALRTSGKIVPPRKEFARRNDQH